VENAAQSGFESFRQRYLEAKPESVEEISFHCDELVVEWVLAGHRTQVVFFVAWIPDFWILSLFPLSELGSNNVVDLYSQEFEWGRSLQEIDQANMILARFDLEDLTIETDRLWGVTVNRTVRMGDAFLVSAVSGRQINKIVQNYGRRLMQTFPAGD